MIPTTLHWTPAIYNLDIWKISYPVTLRFTNTTQNLTHLIIYEYAFWKNPANPDKGIFCLDASIDNMFQAETAIESFAKKRLYLVRAYFDYCDEKETIVQLQNPDGLFEIDISSRNGENYIHFGHGVQILNAEKADKILKLLTN